MPNPYGLQSQSLCIFVSKRQFIVALFKFANIWSRKTCFKILKYHILWPKINYQKIYIYYGQKLKEKVFQVWSIINLCSSFSSPLIQSDIKNLGSPFLHPVMVLVLKYNLKKVFQLN